MNIDFYYDLGSTNSYFALKLLKPIAAKYQAEIIYHPFNLGRVFQENNYVLMEEPKTKMRNRKADLMRWAHKYQLPFQVPDNFPMKTSRALKATLVARSHGFEAEFLDAIFTAYWEQNDGHIGDYGRLAELATSFGLAAGAFVDQCESDEIRQQLIDETEGAKSAGIFGAPTMVLGDEIYWGKDRMDFIEQQLQAGLAKFSSISIS